MSRIVKVSQSDYRLQVRSGEPLVSFLGKTTLLHQSATLTLLLLAHQVTQLALHLKLTALQQAQVQ